MRNCECGHHRNVHFGESTLCVSPEICGCRKFREAAPEPEAKPFAAMTDRELYDWWVKSDSTQAFAALRDAIRAERDAEHNAVLAAAWEKGKRIREAVGLDAYAPMDAILPRLTDLRTRAERAEQERDNAYEAARQMEFKVMNAEAERDNAKTDRQAHIDWLNEQDRELRKSLRTAESALGEARRGVAEECEQAMENAVTHKEAYRAVADIRRKYASEYPATPSGEGVTYSTQGPTGSGGTHATPQPEREPEGEVAPAAINLPVCVVNYRGSLVESASLVRITPDIARRLLALAQTTEGV